MYGPQLIGCYYYWRITMIIITASVTIDDENNNVHDIRKADENQNKVSSEVETELIEGSSFQLI